MRPDKNDLKMFEKSDLSADELRFFGLSVDPFNEVYDDLDTFRYPELDALTAHFVQAINLNQITVLVGPSGSGKSTLIRLAEERAAATLGEKLRAVRNVVDPSRVSCVVLEEAMLTELRGAAPVNALQRATALRQALLERVKSDRTLLIIDDAHRLKPSVFPHLRTLREYGTPHRLMGIILIGEPSLDTLVRSPDVANVFGRTRVRWMPPIAALTERRGNTQATVKVCRTRDYLAHMFARVGEADAYGRIWADDDAVRLVGQLGQHPLNINNVAVKAMRMARQVACRTVTAQAVNMVGAV